MATIGRTNDHLKFERRRRGWTQNDLADEMHKAAIKHKLPVPRGLSGYYVSRWERGVVEPNYHDVHLLCLAFELPSDRLGLPGDASPFDQRDVQALLVADSNYSNDSGTEDVARLTTWLTDTNATDDTVEQIERASVSLAEAHADVPAKRVLGDALRIHRQTQVILRTGRQRLRQTRDLMRVDSNLLAHICLLLGDLGRNERAAQYGTASQLYAQEAGVDEAIAWSVRAKTARWQQRYVESADMARHGFQVSRPTPTRIELAYREANAAALLGDTSRARDALRRAQEAADTLAVNDAEMSVWSFTVARQAVFGISVAIHTGDPDAALRAAAMADAAWAAGSRRIPATWLQVRVGAGIAYLMKGALDGTLEQTAHVLDLPRELRIGTVVAYLDDLDRRLDDPRFANDPIATALRERIREFKLTTALEDEAMQDE